MDLRKLHNRVKRQFIEEYVVENSLVLDCGCGAGGDLFKWPQGTRVFACDPDIRALQEAQKRTQTPSFFHGDITSTPEQPYDIICYNFSIQYIFASERLFRRTLDALKRRCRVGTRLIGVVPDSEELMTCARPFFQKSSSFTGDFGDMISFFIKGTRYYKNGPVAEPVCYREILITELDKIGFKLVTWEPFISFHTGTVSDVYSKFVFEYTKECGGS